MGKVRSHNICIVIDLQAGRPSLDLGDLVTN